MILPLIFGIDEIEPDGGQSKAKRINCKIATFLALATCASTFATFLISIIRLNMLLYTMIIESFTLVLFVFFLRRQINQVQPNLANNKLIMTHLINFSVFTLLMALEILFDLTQYGNGYSEYVQVIRLIFMTYMQLFFVYLTISFTKNIQRTQIND